MKKAALMTLISAASFYFGARWKTITTEQPKTSSNMKKVTGIGGVFFKCKDPKATMEWYHKHLGLNTTPYGVSFEWYETPDSTKKATTQWNPFPETSKYFEPSSKDFMINYRVENLTALVEELKKEGVTVLDNIESYDYGKFVHILDAEGNKIQLWEPID
jgi:predicted enzyme related to lactoylglutathione lyase